MGVNRTKVLVSLGVCPRCTVPCTIRAFQRNKVWKHTQVSYCTIHYEMESNLVNDFAGWNGWTKAQRRSSLMFLWPWLGEIDARGVNVCTI